MIIFYIFIGLILLFFYYTKHVLKLSFKFNTLFKKGFSVETGKWGIICFCAKQGGGKTYAAISYLNSVKNNNNIIISNLKSIKNLDYVYIAKFDDIIEYVEYLCSIKDSRKIIIFYDEIFSLLTKSSKLSSKYLSFISQLRKRHITFLTTAQEWLEINITLRRYVRYQVNCSIFNLFNRSFLYEHYYDGDLLHWSQEDNDYIAPLISSSISKMVLSIANSYDTYEVIDSSDKSFKPLTSDLLLKKVNHKEVEVGDQPRVDSKFDSQFWFDITSDDIDE